MAIDAPRLVAAMKGGASGLKKKGSHHELIVETSVYDRSFHAFEAIGVGAWVSWADDCARFLLVESGLVVWYWYWS